MERAVGLAAQLLGGWAPVISELRLVPASGGRFEVTLDDELVYSKLATNRHPHPGEVVGLIRQRLGLEVLEAQE